MELAGVFVQVEEVLAAGLGEPDVLVAPVARTPLATERDGGAATRGTLGVLGGWG